MSRIWHEKFDLAALRRQGDDGHALAMPPAPGKDRAGIDKQDALLPKLGRHMGMPKDDDLRAPPYTFLDNADRGKLDAIQMAMRDEETPSAKIDNFVSGALLTVAVADHADDRNLGLLG